jgi:hypothetical protein
MSDDVKKIMNQADYAKHRGVSRALITQALQSGKISATTALDGTRLINVEEADREWEQNTFIGNKRGKSGDSVMSEESIEEAKEPSAGNTYAKSRAFRETALARLTHLELQRKMGQLVDARAVELQAFADGRKIRNAMISIPDRVAPILAAENDVVKIHSILAKEIIATLKGLAVELGESA